MENNTLSHHGIKGMRWGIRRFQNKDGGLTAAGRKRYSDNNDSNAESEESKSARRSSALKSTDAAYIYKNRDVLSTNEINERLNRIDTERRLASVAESTKKSGYDRVDAVLKFGRKVNEVYEFTQKPMIQKLISKITGKVPEGMSPNLSKIINNFDKMSDEEVTKALKRANTEKALKNLAKEADEARAKLQQEKVKFDYYNNPDRDSNTGRASSETTYRWSKPKQETGEIAVTGLLDAPKSTTKSAGLLESSTKMSDPIIEKRSEAGRSYIELPDSYYDDK